MSSAPVGSSLQALLGDRPRGNSAGSLTKRDERVRAGSLTSSPSRHTCRPDPDPERARAGSAGARARSERGTAARRLRGVVAAGIFCT